MPSMCCGARTGETCCCYESGWTTSASVVRRSLRRDVPRLSPPQPALDRLRRPMDGARLGNRRHRHSEQSPALNEIGAGLNLSPNALVALRVLGVEDAIIALGSESDFLII